MPFRACEAWHCAGACASAVSTDRAGVPGAATSRHQVAVLALLGAMRDHPE